MKAFIPSTMADVFDLERDLGLMKKGDTESIYYAKVTGINLIMPGTKPMPLFIPTFHNVKNRYLKIVMF